MVNFRIKNYIPSIIFALVVMILSVIPAGNSDKEPIIYFEGIDKLVHCAMYCTLSILLLFDYLKNNAFSLKQIILILSLLLLYSIIIEGIQHFFLTERSGELLDILANLTGILIGTLFVSLFRRLKY